MKIVAGIALASAASASFIYEVTVSGDGNGCVPCDTSSSDSVNICLEGLTTAGCKWDLTATFAGDFTVGPEFCMISTNPQLPWQLFNFPLLHGLEFPNEVNVKIVTEGFQIDFEPVDYDCTLNSGTTLQTAEPNCINTLLAAERPGSLTVTKGVVPSWAPSLTKNANYYYFTIPSTCVDAGFTKLTPTAGKVSKYTLTASYGPLETSTTTVPVTSTSIADTSIADTSIADTTPRSTLQTSRPSTTKASGTAKHTATSASTVPKETTKESGSATEGVKPLVGASSILLVVSYLFL